MLLNNYDFHTGDNCHDHSGFKYAILAMQSKVLKLLAVCVICVGLVYLLVYLYRLFF